MENIYKDEVYKGYCIKFVKGGLVGDYQLFLNDTRVGAYYFHSIKEAKKTIDKGINN